MKVVSIVFSLLLIGCGFDHDVNVNGNVEVKHVFDVEAAYNFFYQQCRAELPMATEEQLSACATQRLNEWMASNNSSWHF